MRRFLDGESDLLLEGSNAHIIVTAGKKTSDINEHKKNLTSVLSLVRENCFYFADINVLLKPDL